MEPADEARHLAIGCQGVRQARKAQHLAVREGDERHRAHPSDHVAQHVGERLVLEVRDHPEHRRLDEVSAEGSGTALNGDRHQRYDGHASHQHEHGQRPDERDPAKAAPAHAQVARQA
jgi:hypothetical protein